MIPAFIQPALESLMVDATEVRQHPRNPKNGDIEAIAESIQVNGLYRPLYVQRSTGYILAGNHTYQALLSLGADRIPVLYLDVDDETAKRVMLADNRTADLGVYDNGLLLDLLEEIQKQDSLLGTGYVDADLAALKQLVAEPPPLEVTDPDFGWPSLHFRVHPKTRAAFYTLTSQSDSDNDKFVMLLRMAGWKEELS